MKYATFKGVSSFPKIAPQTPSQCTPDELSIQSPYAPHSCTSTLLNCCHSTIQYTDHCCETFCGISILVAPQKFTVYFFVLLSKQCQASIFNKKLWILQTPMAIVIARCCYISNRHLPEKIFDQCGVGSTKANISPEVSGIDQIVEVVLLCGMFDLFISAIYPALFHRTCARSAFIAERGQLHSTGHELFIIHFHAYLSPHQRPASSYPLGFIVISLSSRSRLACALN